MKPWMLVVGVLLIGLYRLGASPDDAPAQIEQAVIASSDYAYIGPPTISRGVYADVFCRQNGADSEICVQAPAMYDAVIAAGADPALELAHASNESSFGTGGVGMAPWHNLHGIHGHSGGLGTPFVNSAPGDENMQEYGSYADAVADWVWLIRDGGLYYPDRNDPESVLAIYCECGGAGGKADYVARMKAQIDGWRAQSAPQAAPAGSYASTPIDLGGDCGWNVTAALNANGGALQHITLAPGETFSFNATMGDPERASYRTCAGVPGGNWCNLAARYSQVARAMGLVPQFQDHGVGDLGGGPENSVAIWNEDGVAGAGQDLLITNTTDRPVFFVARSDGASVTIEGGF